MSTEYVSLQDKIFEAIGHAYSSGLNPNTRRSVDTFYTDVDPTLPFSPKRSVPVTVAYSAPTGSPNKQWIDPVSRLLYFYINNVWTIAYDPAAGSSVVKLAPSATIDTTNASNITTGTLPLSVLPASVVGGGNGSVASSQISDATTIGKTLLTSSTASSALASLSGQPLSTELTALSNASTTGLYVRTGSGTSVTRTLTSNNASNLVVTNGDGVAGNPTIDLANVGTAIANSLVSITTDATGRVTASSPAVIAGISDSGVAGRALVQAATITAAKTVLNISVTDVSGLAASATTDTTNAANITSGLLPQARLGASTLGLTLLNASSAAVAKSSLAIASTDITDAGATGQALIQASSTTAAKTALSLSATDVGLGNVNNTSDANKPVSTAQSTAIANAQTNAINSANTYSANASNITSGTLASARLPSTVTASTRALTATDAGANFVNNESTNLTLSALPAGLGTFTITQGSTGTITVTAGSGVTISGSSVTSGANSSILFKETASGNYAGTLLVNLSALGVTIATAANAAAVITALSLAASATTDTTNASNITSGTLPSARLPSPVAATSRILTTADAGTDFQNNSSTNYTLSALPAGLRTFTITQAQGTVGSITITPGSGVTIVGPTYTTPTIPFIEFKEYTSGVYTAIGFAAGLPATVPQDGTYFYPPVSALYFVATATAITTSPLVVQLLGTDSVEVGRFSLDTLNTAQLSSLLTALPNGIKPVVLSGAGTYTLTARVTKS